MRWLMAIASVCLIVIALQDVFETLLLPRRIKHLYRFSRLFFIYSWTPWAAIGKRLGTPKRRGRFLSYFGPLSVLVLFASWATWLIFGFALLHWSLGTPLKGTPGPPDLKDYTYFSGVTFFTLGYGDYSPIEGPGRLLSVIETGIGYGFLAMAISYLPVLYQAFSRREVSISLLDARAGSPPTAGALLERVGRHSDLGILNEFLREWERWEAELLESHVSFPVLSYYRSQHDNQSWLAALTAILDTSALLVSSTSDVDVSMAWMTFAMGRHAAVDLAQVTLAPPTSSGADRLPPTTLAALRDRLRAAGIELSDSEAAVRRLKELRGMYEPFVQALSARFLLELPPVFRVDEPVDNWQTSSWMRRARGLLQLAADDGPEVPDDHDD